MAWPDPFTRSRTVQVGGVDTFVAEAGHGPPVLMLHGNPETHTLWSGVAERLAGVRCIAPDLPGYGKSHASDEADLSLEGQAEWVRSLAQALELDRFHFVVHDIGAFYGLAFATLHPQRLLSLTIFNTVFFPDYRWHFWARVWRTRGLGETSMAIVNRALFRREFRRGSPDIPRDYADQAYRELTPTAKRTVLRYYRAMDPEVWTGWDTRMIETLREVPRQVVWGVKDPFIPVRFSERFGAEVHHVDRGHWVMVEDPELAAAKIAALIARAS